MQVNLVDTKQSFELSDGTFGRAFNEALVHQVVTAYLAGARAGTHAQKTRSEVSGGGKKPWRQKGTGRARAGTIRSPIWRSGGVAFAAKPRDYSQKVNKKMYRAAISSILSELIRTESLKVVEELTVAEPKTKLFKQKLADLGCDDNLLIIVPELDENLYYASRNIPNVLLIDINSVNPFSLLKHKQVLVVAEAMKQLEERLA